MWYNLSKSDDLKYFIWEMMEPDYIMNVMTSVNALVSDDTWKSFKVVD